MNFIKMLMNHKTEKQTDLLENTIRLTDTQKAVLLKVFVAPTPELGYDATVGSENIRQAAISLREFGMIMLDDVNSQAGVTDEGQTELQNNSLLDDMGTISPEGEQFLASAEEEIVRESGDISRLSRFLLVD